MCAQSVQEIVKVCMVQKPF